MGAFWDAIIVASGNSTRIGTNKLFLPIGTDTVLHKTVAAFCDIHTLNHIIVVTRQDTLAQAQESLAEYGDRLIFTIGGDTRTQSVENGLAAATMPVVLIHDGARPFITSELINNVAYTALEFGSAVPAIPVVDSVRKVTSGHICASSPDRNQLFCVQTPQGFSTSKIREAFSKRNGEVFTDESALYSAKILPAKIVEGDVNNKKITNLSDYFGINAKIGMGYDIHKLIPQRKLVLGGVEIASDLGALAHSDGDAIIHALIDALLCAIGELDIGSHFPDNDPKYDGIESTIMLSEVMEIVAKTGAKINNVSIIVILDKPKLQDYILVMRVKLANILGISYNSIAISAKTTEGTSPHTVSSYATVTLI